jgi:hypothetical protein
MVRSGLLAVEWEMSAEARGTSAGGRRWYFAPFQDRDLVGIPGHDIDEGANAPIFLNERNAFVQWFSKIADAVEDGNAPIEKDHLHRLANLLDTPTRIDGYKYEMVLALLDSWRAAEWPEGLKIPQVAWSRRNFSLVES